MKKIIGKNGEIREMSMEQAFKEYQGLIQSIARRKAYNDPQILEDLYQEGCIGLIKAYHGYDAGMGYSFTTYAVPKILSEIMSCLREANPRTGQLIRQPRNAKKRHDYQIISIDEPISASTEGDKKIIERVEVLDMGAEIEDDIIAKLDIDRFIGSIKCPRHRQILKIYRDNDGIRQTEVAKMVGVSQIQVSKVRRQYYREWGLKNAQNE